MKPATCSSRAARMLVTLAALGLQAGCVTQKFEQSMNAAIQLNDRCRLLQDAVPAAQGKLEETLRNAVFVRLTGACHDRETGESCLGKDGMDSMEAALRQERALGDAAATRIDSTVALFTIQQRDLLARAERLGKDLRADMRTNFGDKGQLLEDLQNVRRAISLSDASFLKTCTSRLDCMRQLADWINQRQAATRNALSTLQQRAERAAGSAQKTADELSVLAAQLRASMATSSGQLAESVQRVDDLAANTRALGAAIQRLATHARIGMRAVDVIGAGDVQQAAMLFFADKLWAQAAESTLDLIDNTIIRPTDRLVDKLDDKFFLLATFGTMVYQNDIQQLFDKLYFKTVVRLFPTPAARLAFANAACQKLMSPPRPGEQRASLVQPFVWAMLTNVEVEVLDLGKPEGEMEMYLKKVEDLRKSRSDQPARQAADDLTMVAAYNVAMAKEIAGRKMVSLPQQISICASAQAALADSPAAAGRRALDECGRAGFDASTAATAALPNPPELGIAVAAAVRAALAERGSQGQPPAPPVLPQPLPAPFDAFCARMHTHLQNVQCVPAPDTALLTIRTYLPPNLDHSTKLDEMVAAVADQLPAAPALASVRVEGFASSSLKPCATKAREDTCGHGWNQALATERAKRVKDILVRRAGLPADQVFSSGRGDGQALQHDSALDRRVRIILTAKKTPTAATQARAGDP